MVGRDVEVGRVHFGVDFAVVTDVDRGYSRAEPGAGSFEAGLVEVGSQFLTVLENEIRD